MATPLPVRPDYDHAVARSASPDTGAVGADRKLASGQDWVRSVRFGSWTAAETVSVHTPVTAVYDRCTFLTGRSCNAASV